MLGIGASGLPSDWQLFCVDGMKGVNREMTREALDIMLKVWASDGGLEYQGQVLERERAGSDAAHAGPSFAPAAAAASAYRNRRPRSRIGNVELAGEHGFMPLSLNMSPGYVATHWEAVLRRRAAQRRTPSRQDWRIVREIFVADTDEEAHRNCVGGMMGRMMRQYLLPLMADFQFTRSARATRTSARERPASRTCSST